MSTITIGFDTFLDFANSGEILLAGTRIGLEQVVEAYESGASAEEIAWRYPTAALDQIHAAIAYYLSHKEEVQTYINHVQSASNTDQLTAALRHKLDQRHQIRVKNGRIHITPSTAS